MLSIFKTNRIVLSLLLIPYAFLLRSYGLFGEVPTDFDNGGILSDWIFETIGLNDQILVITSMALIVIQAIYLILFTNNGKLSNEQNLFAGLFYVLFSSMSISFLGLTPALMGNTFLLLALSELYNIYKHKEPSGHHFNAGFWLALGALFYGSIFLFFFFGLLAINLMRAFNIREMLQFTSGYAVPFILLFTYYFYIGDVDESYWAYLESSFGIMDFREFPVLSGYITLGVFAILLLVSIFNYGAFVDRQGMKVRKNYNMLFLFFPFAIGSIFIQSGVGMEHLIIFAIPLSILIGQIFFKMKKQIWAEALHIILLALVPLCHYLLS